MVDELRALVKTQTHVRFQKVHGKIKLTLTDGWLISISRKAAVFLENCFVTGTCIPGFSMKAWPKFGLKRTTKLHQSGVTDKALQNSGIHGHVLISVTEFLATKWAKLLRLE